MSSLVVPIVFLAATGAPAAAEFRPVAVGLCPGHFAGADSIQVSSVKSTFVAPFEQGADVLIEGTYLLSTQPKARIAAYLTNGDVSGKNGQLHIVKGSGSFKLEIHVERRGIPHVSFYPDLGGDSFGGIWFGAGRCEDARSGWSPSAEPGAVEPETFTRVTISKAYWYDGPDRPQSITIDDDGLVHALLHAEEQADEKHRALFRGFIAAVDRDFILRAPGKKDVRAEARARMWSSEIQLNLSKGEYDSMDPGTPYRLIPANTKPAYQWIVRDSATLTRPRR